LALAALAGLTLILNWDATAPVRAEEVITAPVGARLVQQHSLPPPYLSDDDVVDAPYDNPPAPIVDGFIAPGEYAGAGKVTFSGYGGAVEVFFKQDRTNLYIAFDFSDPQTADSATQVFLDTHHDGGTAPQTDDYRFSITRSGIASAAQGDGTTWGGTTFVAWTAATTVTLPGWQAEFSIQCDKLGLTAGTFQTMGLSLINAWTPSGDHYWPNGAFWTTPSSWGILVSSSDWDTFYWKPGPWEDYAPSGMPDFDQMQLGLTYDGPVAMANSLWWFDAKFEETPVGPTGPPPSTIPVSDSYTLVQPYGSVDDHDPQNAVSLTLELYKHFGTDIIAAGTNVYSMYHGIQTYLRDHYKWDEYVVTLVNQPEFEWIADEVMRSEDVILLLGFYEWKDPDGTPSNGDEYWNRFNGHYVTVSGVDPLNYLIALSDPAQDNAEKTGSGRVLSGTLITHQPITHSTMYTLHNDAGNVSHDVYRVSLSLSPGGTWGLEDYTVPEVFQLIGEPINLNPKWLEAQEIYEGGEIFVEIEYALAVSPYTWKASGRWVEDESVELYGETFIPYEDFAPSGVPDFDQKQDEWFTEPSPAGQWTHCGPVAAANSLWWFDSKFEFAGATPPTISDTYPLVLSATPDTMDDHHPDNVQNVVNELAALAKTNVVQKGTLITDLYTAVITYITDHELRQGYIITKVNKPEFWWVAEEVEVSEDVILLLGFYADFSPEPDIYEWRRVGGHYVTVPGVDKQGGFIAFSDPYWDRMETVLPPRAFIGWPDWTGRVGSDGDPPLGPTGLLPAYKHRIPHTGVSVLHNDAANVSHDVYHVVTSTSPGGIWGPENYVTTTEEITNFLEMNGPVEVVIDPSDILTAQAEVEWALAVSPVADLWIDKQVTPTTVYPGSWITFTLRYGNDGNLAENVVISDVLPQGLTNTQVVSMRNTYGANIATYDTFTWTVGNVPWNGMGNGYGIITVTAQVDQEYDWPWESTLTNTAEITTTTQEQYQLEERPNKDWVTFTVVLPPTWNKWVSGTLWHTVFSVTVETSDTLEVIDVISSSQHFTLRETWNADHLDLLSATLDPASSGSVVTSANALKLTAGGWVTLTKLFHIEACTWTQTMLTETLWIDGQTVDGQTWQKPVTITKQTPNLHVAATYEPEVFPGQELTFTLHYSNTGGYENDVTVGSVLPTVTTFITCSRGAPDDGRLLPDGRIWRGWDVGDLAKSDHDTLMITALVTNTLVPSNTFVISGTIDDHNGDLKDTNVFTIHVSPPQAQWDKHVYVNSVLTSTRPVPVVPSDTVQVVDRVWLTYTKPVTLSLVETWTHSLALTGTTKATTGTVIASSTGVQWSANGVATNTWHVLTKTFHITGTEWLFDYLTETLAIEGDADTQQTVVRFRHKDVCWPVRILTLTSNSPIDIGQATTFSATVEGDSPITYTWDFGGAGTGNGTDGPTPVYTYTNSGIYTATLDVANDCGTDTHTTQVTVSPPPQPAWEKVVAVNGDIISTTSIPVVAGAMIEIVDRVWVTHTGNVTFTLVETWSPSLDLTDWASNTAQATISTATQATTKAVTWHAADVTANTWHILTKTYRVLAGTWTTDHITEHLGVEDAAVQLADRVVTFTHGCEPLGSVDFDWSPSNPGTGDVVTFTATYTPSYASLPTFEWAFGDGKTSTGNPVYNTYYLSGTYTAILSATNDCTPLLITKPHTLVVTGPPFVPTHGVALAPPRDTASGNPGDDVVYTLWMTNTGNTADTFNLTASLSPWAMSAVPSTISLPPSRTHQVTVTVTIPNTAQCGDSNVITITATSQTSPTVSDFSVLTISANEVRGINLSPPTDTQAATPGKTVTYTLQVTNTGNCTDILDLAVSGNLWTTTLSITETGVLNAGARTSVDVTVAIPMSANNGDDDTATITATSSDGAITDTSALTTTAMAACTEVTDVVLTVASAGTIYTDTDVILNADIIPDNAAKPYSYTVLTDSGLGSPMTATADPLVFTQTFATTGTHTVEIHAWNCGMTTQVTDVITLTVREQGVCVDLTSVTIHGATSGYPNNYTFTTRYKPGDASIPISYTWDDGSNGNTSVRYLSVGTYTLGVTATNSCSTGPAVTDSHEIIIIKRVPTHTLTVYTVGQGSVALKPPGGVYTEGLVVELVANAASGYAFDQWSGALKGDANPANLTMDTDKTVTATFKVSTLPTYTLNVSTVGHGTVERAPSQTTYVSGTVVRLTANAEPGWYFVTWRGDVTIANNPVSLTMNANKAVTAMFDTTPPPTYTLTVNIIGHGTVMKFPSQTTYISGTLVQLGAVPENGWNFTGWHGDLKGTENPTHTIMTKDKEITATFTVACQKVTGASFTYEPPAPYTSERMTFKGHVARGDAPITWNWAFGDGQFGNGQTVTHTYMLSDTYTVVMTATNCGGTGVATAMQKIAVLKAPSKLYLPLILRNAGTP
jgi:uncharacterized repeat protein (TIGR01451 family)